MITGVAIKTNTGEVISLPKPYRHWHLTEVAENKEQGLFEESKQGFVTDKGVFLTRQEALVYAREHQNIEPKYSPNELFSEDLW